MLFRKAACFLQLIRFGIQLAEAKVPPPCGFVEKGCSSSVLDSCPTEDSLHTSTCFLSAVSISDVETVRKGHDSELLRSLAEDYPLEQGFTIVFRGRRSNLDVVAGSPEEAQVWIQGLQLLVDIITSMDQQERLDQYQQYGSRVWAWNEWDWAVT